MLQMRSSGSHLSRMHCNRYKRSNWTSRSEWTRGAGRASRASRAGWSPRWPNRHGSSYRLYQPGSAAHSTSRGRCLVSFHEQQPASSHWTASKPPSEFSYDFLFTRLTIACSGTIQKQELIILCDKLPTFHVYDACEAAKMLGFPMLVIDESLHASCDLCILFPCFFYLLLVKQRNGTKHS